MSNFFSRFFEKQRNNSKNQKFSIGQKVQLKPNHPYYEEYKNIVTCFEIFRIINMGYDLDHPALYNKQIGNFFLLGDDDNLDIYTILIQQ